LYKHEECPMCRAVYISMDGDGAETSPDQFNGCCEIPPPVLLSDEQEERPHQSPVLLAYTAEHPYESYTFDEENPGGLRHAIMQQENIDMTDPEGDEEVVDLENHNEEFNFSSSTR
jgi:hypothetical protein